MDIAEMALMAKHKGELEKAFDLFQQAFDKEKQSAEFFQTLMAYRLSVFKFEGLKHTTLHCVLSNNI
ncbi:MAG: hypothetical protein DRR19_04475 [Candidatus Parabeggiatoa sp. nov. 1]|nr:MAG: hypothetical protein DRR19_04475 [Gammaproteobacteria bacterium]